MKCPHCGNFIENTLWQALQPYRRLNLPVVVTNIDGILEVGNRIKAIFEEKRGKNLNVRGFQAVTLKKVAKSLNVPLYYILRDGNNVILYEYDTQQIVQASVFLDRETLNPVFTGSISELGEWIYEKFLAHAPRSKRRC